MGCPSTKLDSIPVEELFCSLEKVEFKRREAVDESRGASPVAR